MQPPLPAGNASDDTNAGGNKKFIAEGSVTESQKALAAVNRQMEEQRVQGKARTLGLNYVDISNYPINPDMLHILSEAEARIGQLIPFYQMGKKVRIAVVDLKNPKTKDILDKLKQQKYLLNINLCSAGGLKEVLALYQSQLFQKKQVFVNEFDEMDLGAYEEEIETLRVLKDKIASVSPAEAVNTVMVGSMKTGASDIHIEPYEKVTKIRFRIDGILQDIMDVSPDAYKHIISEIKYRSNLKLNVTNVAQDGRFSFVVNKRNIDVRVSVIPTVFGESVVMRLLDNARKVLTMEELGLKGLALERIQRAVKKPNGMILTTGPTGSGKTTTLYSMLGEIANPEVKVITLEDPVEYHVFGIVQSQIYHEKGYGFAEGLRAVVRQDPDVVMVGEIRDLETSEIAAQAALTGHLVLSTLHTNSAVGSISRLISMGLEPYMTAPALTMVIAQRLVRMICNECKEEYTPNKEEIEIMKKNLIEAGQISGEVYKMPDKFMHGKGCDACAGTGYKGRIGLYEVFEKTVELEKLILAAAPKDDIYKLVRKEGMLTMREGGMIQVMEGKTTLEEVLRITG